MHIEFIYSSWDRPSQNHSELRDVNASPYVGTPSLAAAALAATLGDEHRVTFRDDRVKRVEPGPGPDLVAMPIFTPAADRAMELADAYRAAGVPVIAGGIFTSLMPDVIAEHVDSLCIGEGEGVFPQMIADFEAGQLKPRYRADNKVDHDTTPVPRYELYAQWVDQMRAEGLADYPDLDFPVQLSRGCPMGCDHCVVPQYLGPSLRYVSPEKIRACFESILSLGEWRGGTLVEDTTILSSPRIQNHLTAVAEACADLDTKVSYIGSSPQFIEQAKQPFFDAMKSLGVLEVYLMFGFGTLSRAATAIGSGEPEMQRVLDTVQRIQDNGLEVYGSFSVGHDQEGESVYDRVMEICSRGNIKVAEFAVATPYPGTPAWHRLNAEGRMLGKPWKAFNDANVTFAPKHMSPEKLQQIYLDLWVDFYKDRPRSKWPVQV